MRVKKEVLQKAIQADLDNDRSITPKPGAAGSSPAPSAIISRGYGRFP